MTKFNIQEIKEKIVKSAHNRRCTSSICIQTLCKVWIILIEHCWSFRLHQLGYRPWQIVIKKCLSSAYRKYMKKIFKSAHNRRCTSSICIQTLCKVWIILIENCTSYRLHLVSTALLEGRTDGRRKRFLNLLPPSATQVIISC